MPGMTDSHDFHEEEAVARVYDWRLLRRILVYLGPYRWWALGALVLLLASSVVALVGPLATAVILDLFVAPSGAEGAWISRWVGAWLEARGHELTPAEGVLATAGFYGVSIILGFGILYAQGYLMEMMGQRIMHDLRRQVFGHLQKLSIGYFDRNPIGRLVTRATTDVAALSELLTAGLVSMIGDLFTLTAVVVVLFALDWRLALVTLSILPLVIGLTLWFKLGARRSFRQVRVKIARINAFLQEHITGMSIVQLFGREARAHKDFSEINAEHREANIQAILYYAVYYPGNEFILALGMAAIIFYGGGQILAGVLSFGALVAFLQYAQRFFRPIANLAEKYNVLQAAMASCERIFELLDTEIEVASPEAAHRAEVRGDIRFDRVVFGYNPEEPVLQDVSFSVEQGETVAVVGHTGAGKSTLTNLLLRFYDVQSGRVTVDGVDVRQWDLGALRGGIAMVLQDVFLFSGDIASNIRLGEGAISDEAVRQAASEVHALELIEGMREGFSTTVRERGAGLSVGQKQLIAFARALAFDPQILVLDEATASVDTETEQHIQQALDRLLVGRTSVIIAHRLSTVQRADRILVMHHGRLEEQGTHRELLAQRGLYYRLVQLQFPEAFLPVAPDPPVTAAVQP